jgi:hypothetical protein
VKNKGTQFKKHEIMLNTRNTMNKTRTINTFAPAKINKANKTGIKILMTFIIMTGITGSVFAQDSVRTQNIPYNNYGDDFKKYELSLGVFWRNVFSDENKWGAGLNYKLDDGTSSGIYTAGWATHLIMNITNNIGLVSGFEIASYSGKATGNFNENYTATHADGTEFIYTYSLKNYAEQQKLTLFSIPLMVKFSTNPFSDIYMKYFAACGFKVSIPLARTATINPGSVTTTGYFHEEGMEYSGFPNQGFVTGFNAPEQKSKIDFKMGVALALETGITFISNEDLSAGASIYCDVGLNNLLKPGNRYMVEYRRLTPEQLLFNSIMTTKRINSVEMFSIGLKLSVNFNLDKKAR